MTQGDGFQTNVGELEKIANNWLPATAATLRTPMAVLGDHTPTPRPMNVPEVYDVEKAYSGLTQAIADRLENGAKLVDETAEALREIAALYRRVDGQG